MLSAAQNCTQPPGTGGVLSSVWWRSDGLRAVVVALRGHGQSGGRRAATRSDGRLRRHVSAPSGVGRSALVSPSTQEMERAETSGPPAILFSFKYLNPLQSSIEYLLK